MDAKKKSGVINSGLLSGQEKKDFENRVKSCPADKRIAVITHDKADPDALSAIALTQLLEGWGFKSDIFSEGNSSNPMNTTMISKLNIEIRNKKFFIENRDAYGLIILFDTGVSHCFLGHEDFKELIKKGKLAACHPDIIIDHHPLNTIPKNCLIFKKEVGAAATILYNLFREFSLVPDARIATALALGISADTKDLTLESETTDFDREAHKELRLLYDYPLFEKINKRFDLTVSHLKLLGKAFTQPIYHDENILILGVGCVSGGQTEFLAHIVDIAMRSDVKLAMIIGIEDFRMFQVKVRKHADLINVNELCKKVFEDPLKTDIGIASAGGRTASGGAQVPLVERERKIFENATEEEREELFLHYFEYYKERLLQHMKELGF
ncbi:MAG: DHH family phosphoesterase [Candidatus Falkowbacteria bacterium]